MIAVGSDETLPDISGLKISLSGMNTQADFNLADGTLAAKESKANIEMNVNADGTTAEAIILPTTTLDGVKMTFVLDGKTFEWPVSVNGGAGFEAGYKYMYTATLSTENGKPAVTMGGASIESWTDQPGGDINVDFGEGGGEQPEGEKVLLDEKFDSGIGAFTIEDKTKPSELDYIWKFDKGTTNSGSEYAYMKASAFKDQTKYESESWLVSPEVDLAGATTITFTFEHAINKVAGDVKANHKVYAKEVGGEWQELTGFIYPAGTDWNFIGSGDIDLSSYKGKKIQIGFQYTSTASSAATWELKNVKIVADGEGGGTVEPEPEPEPTPGNNLLINPGFEEWGEKLPIKWDNNYNIGEIVKEATIKHSGDYSLRQTSSSKTSKIQQEAEVLGGKKYRLSYWFLDNDAKASSRYWFALVDANGKTVNDLNAEIQQEEYSVDNPDWQQVKIEITMPENVVKVRFEIRTYRNMTTDEAGGYIYYDDMELIQLD